MVPGPPLDVDATQEMLELAAAQAALRAAVARLPVEEVPLAALDRRVLATALAALHDLPAFANSALDGYALRAAEAPGPLPVAFDVSAGDDPPPLARGSAAAIATGGLLPAGADAIAAVERVARHGGRVEVLGPIVAGDGVRPAGADVAAGAEAIAAGALLSPHAASAVAALGYASAPCVRRPRALVLATGDELVAPGAPLRRGQIHDSNTTLVDLTLRRLGCEPLVGGRVPDDLAGTQRVFADAAEHDLVVSSGGVSVGPRDHVKPALAALGAELLFWRVAIQPGKPAFAAILPSGALVLALPGNPLSVLAGLHLLVRPAVDALLGRPPRPPLEVVLGAPVRRLQSRLRALPAQLAGGVATPLAEASHQVARAAAADALVLVPRGDGEVAAGTAVEAVPLEI
jgi:molybdopterin molybdotransferase